MWASYITPVKPPWESSCRYHTTGERNHPSTLSGLTNILELFGFPNRGHSIKPAAPDTVADPRVVVSQRSALSPVKSSVASPASHLSTMAAPFPPTDREQVSRGGGGLVNGEGTTQQLAWMRGNNHTRKRRRRGDKGTEQLSP